MKRTALRGRAKAILTLCTGIVIGMLLVGGAGAQAIEEYLRAYPSSHTIYLDGQEIKLEAYVINGSNYVKLRDVGAAVGFNVYWKDGVQVDTTSTYTGEPPVKAEPPSEPATTESDTVRQEMIRRINQVRRENGAKELIINDALMEAAQICSAQGFTSHNNQYECETALSCGYPYGFGSNLTVFTVKADMNIAQKAVTNWANSPGHFQTMTADRYDSIGVGVTVNGGIAYCYMFAGNPNGHNPYE